MQPSPAAREISRLDPVADHQRITLLVLTQEFPWDAQRALELALFRTFCVPSISRILVHSGEFEERPQKRYDDTEIITSELIEHGYDSDRGKRAIKRMNQLHARFDISNEDYLYVLSTFLVEPVRFIDKFGYRRISERERIALFHFWREVGKRMNIRDMPESYDAFDALNVAFEREHFVYSDSNRRIGTAGLRLLESWLPRPLRPSVKWVVGAMLDEQARNAFGFPHPPRALPAALSLALRLRGRALQRLPKRITPVSRAPLVRPSYPQGYQLEQLGPAPQLAAQPSKRKRKH